MQFRILGPVEVWDGSRSVPIGGPKPRALLAALLLEAGNVVSVDRLVDTVWSESAPQTAVNLVHTYVRALRRALDRSDRASSIVTRRPGYVFDVVPDELDRAHFQRLAEQGRHAAAEGRHDVAAEQLRAALALWRGPALGGVGDARMAGEAARLEDMRLEVLEQRIAADLALGQYDDLCSELVALVDTYPTRERLLQNLMIALYAADRRADASAVYRCGRAALIDELGIEPGQSLRETHQAILRDDRAGLGLPPARPPAVGSPVAPVSPVSPAPENPVPAQLPYLPGDFTGRHAELAVTRSLLSPETASVPICVVSGLGGVGKSTLALRAAHDVAAEYPDGQFFVRLNGTIGTPAEPGVVLTRLLSALGVATSELPEAVDELADRWRSLMAGRRMLIVLDDADGEWQVRPLLPGCTTSAVLVTSRRRLPGLAGAHLIELDVLHDGEALQLLARIAGPERIAAEPDAAMRLVEQSGRLPLAVRIIATRLAMRPHWSAARLSTRLADESGRLDELVAGDQQVRSAIEAGYLRLGPQARCLLRRLGLLGLQSFPSWVAAALLDAPQTVADDAVEALLDDWCIQFGRNDPAGQALYRLNDLVRIHARERALDEEAAAEGSAAMRRVMDGWLIRGGGITGLPANVVPHARIGPHQRAAMFNAA